MPEPLLSLVVPTRNERGNVAPLIDAVRVALGHQSWEAVFVDDSDDGTDAAVQAIAASDERVRLLHREVNQGGLAGAALAGFGIARGRYICVLDGDLQHPPAAIPSLLAAAERTGADVVVASRYVSGGDPGGLAGPSRQLYSRGLKLLSKAVFPRRLAGVTDPLGGFFLVRRSLVDGVRMHPIGYKILLEVLVRCRPRRVVEVPYRFAPRTAGATKADVRQGLRFLHHLARLAWECSPALRRLRAYRQRSGRTSRVSR
jgi:glycosyltransferase involved in cell wall biosynthesis